MIKEILYLFRRPMDLRWHHVRGVIDGIAGYDSDSSRAANKIRRHGVVRLVSGEDSICRHCPKNPSAPNFDTRLDACDPNSGYVTQKDFHAHSYIQNRARYFGFNTDRPISLKELDAILRVQI